MAASSAGRCLNRPRMCAQASSTVAVLASALPGAPHTTMPCAVQAGMSMALLRMPVVISRRSLGSARMRSAGNGVRSRIATITSKGSSVASTCSSGMKLLKIWTSASPPSEVQSA
ncbi:hypothetical protein G6F65_022702 [Rhizopus arrhizus]|nr:hypothetical protein G6F65_022702 [Rhizopus arrhizus]